MSLTDSPNKLESAFIQRNYENQYYEEINVSGSDLIIYHDSSGILTADKVSVFAAKYGLSPVVSSSYAFSSSYSKSGSYSLSSSYAPNFGPRIKAGRISYSSFSSSFNSGDYLTASVIFGVAMPNGNYEVGLTWRDDNNQWIPCKVTGSTLSTGFTASVEVSAGLLNGDVLWTVVQTYDL